MEIVIDGRINRIIHGDCLEVMCSMPSESVGLVVTSPPYNLLNSTGGGMHNGGMMGKWRSRGGGLIGDGYEGYPDNLPEDVYQSWLYDCMIAVVRLLKPDGAAFVVFKSRVQDGLEQSRDWVWRQLPVRQTIIWQKRGGFNFNLGYFVPTHELVYLIAKPEFHLDSEAVCWGTVWSDIWPDLNNWHPASFPVSLAERCIRATLDNGVILDPFIGSGTTGVAAERLGRDWIGIEQSKTYCRKAMKRIESERQRKLLF